MDSIQPEAIEVMAQAGLTMDSADVIRCELSVAGGEAAAEELCALDRSKEDAFRTFSPSGR